MIYKKNNNLESTFELTLIHRVMRCCHGILATAHKQRMITNDCASVRLSACVPDSSPWTTVINEITRDTEWTLVESWHQVGPRLLHSEPAALSRGASHDLYRITNYYHLSPLWRRWPSLVHSTYQGQWWPWALTAPVGIVLNSQLVRSLVRPLLITAIRS